MKDWNFASYFCVWKESKWYLGTILYFPRDRQRSGSINLVTKKWEEKFKLSFRNVPSLQQFTAGSMSDSIGQNTLLVFLDIAHCVSSAKRFGYIYVKTSTFIPKMLLGIILKSALPKIRNLGGYYKVLGQSTKISEFNNQMQVDFLEKGSTFVQKHMDYIECWNFLAKINRLRMLSLHFENKNFLWGNQVSANIQRKFHHIWTKGNDKRCTHWLGLINKYKTIYEHYLVYQFRNWIMELKIIVALAAFFQISLSSAFLPEKHQDDCFIYGLQSAG